LLTRVIHIICSLWLALLLLFGTTPKEAVHLFATHTDTVHVHHDTNNYLEKEHHHCGFLELLLSPFANDAMVFTCHFHEPVFFTWSNVTVEDRLCDNPLHTALRGPPAHV